MKNLVKLIAPAKVNIVLAVGEKQPSGLHEVHTVMHTLSLHDTISMRRFEEEDGGLRLVLACETAGDINPLGVAPEENIAYKAVMALAAALGRTEHETIEISLSKVIPAESGLGGGSSNAAAALLGAATLWDVDPASTVVQGTAAALGADVPFFLHGGCARMSGCGDVFEAALEPYRGFVLLVRPSAGVSTPQAYATFDEAPQYPTSKYLSWLAGVTTTANLEPYNNMEAAACRIEPKVAEVMSWASVTAAGKAKVVLCGSGSAVCLMCASYQQACEFSLEARKRGWWARVTSFSPLGASVVSAV